MIFTLSNGTRIELPTRSAFEALQRLCNETNTNLAALQGLVSALQNNDSITSVDPLTENGKVVGYTIKFAKSNPIVIYNGKDGANGTNGVDGTTPVIGVKQDVDGIYYWTSNGAFILVDGQKIRAQGTNGADGADGITPELKIESGYWYISYDNGATWTQLGKATGENGQDADGIKITQDENNVYFELADGTIITMSKTGKIIDPNIIQFEDERVKKLCVTVWDTNGDHELSYEEAAAVTTLSNIFKGNTEIQLFNELKYFTGLTAIEDAFSGCTNLWRVTIPANVRTLDSRTFETCSQLKRVMFEPGSKLTVIPEGIFGSSSLSLIEIPASVETIEASAFYDSDNLTAITFEANSKLKTIEAAFHSCNALTSITIPASVETIAAGTFEGCKSLSAVYFEKGSQLKTIEGCNDKEEGVFARCTSLKTITIPANVQTVGSEAFAECEALESVYFENGSKLRTIEGRTDDFYYNGAFYMCRNLSLVDASACTQVRTIGKGAFEWVQDIVFKIGTEIPPACAGSLGFADGTDRHELYVPKGCVEDYKQTDYWASNFKLIYELD